MVLPFLSRTPQRDLGPHDSPPTDSPPSSSHGGSGSGARADAARKTKEEVDHLLAKLEKEGLEIDDKIASIISDGITRIKAEAARRDLSGPEENMMLILLTISSAAAGFVMGMEWLEYTFLKKWNKRRRA